MTHENELTYDGITQTITEWALDYGIPIGEINKRLNAGWPVGCAIREPVPVNPGDKLKERRLLAAINKEYCRPAPKVISKPLRLTFNGVERTLAEWSRLTGIKRATLRWRLLKGWSPADILNKRSEAPGVGCDFDGAEGTGGGTAAQDIPEMEFSEKAA